MESDTLTNKLRQLFGNGWKITLLNAPNLDGGMEHIQFQPLIAMSMSFNAENLELETFDHLKLLMIKNAWEGIREPCDGEIKKLETIE